MDTEAPCKRGGATEEAPAAPEPMTIGEKRAAEAKAAAAAEASTPPVIPEEMTIGEKRAAEAKAAAEARNATPIPIVTEDMTVGEKRAAEARAEAEAAATKPVEEKPTPKLTIGEKRAAEAKAAAEAAATKPVEQKPAPKPTVGQQRVAEAKAAKAKAEAEAAKAVATSQENTDSNNGSVLTNAEEEDDPIEPTEEKKPDTKCFPVQEQPTNKKTRLGDPTLPHLLRIGEDSTSEYIDFLPSSLVSTGGFNAIETGFAPKELPKLYNVYTTEGYAAMQRAFGVKDRQSRAPIHDYILKKCKFQGFDLVVKALEHRMCTLNESIIIKADTTKTKLNMHRLEYIKKLLAYMSKITEPCVKEKPTKNIQTNTVPCLGDLNLLRDLIYLVVLLHGNADSSVKQQLERIPLDKLLEAAKSNNVSQTKPLVAEAIKILYDALKTAKETEKEVPAEVLKTIYKVVAADETPETITVEMITGKIQSTLKDLDEKIKTVKQCEETEAKVTNYEERLKELDRLLGEVNTKLVETLAKKNSDSEAAAKESSDTITGLEEKLAALQDQLTKTVEKQVVAETASAETSASSSAEKAAADAELASLRNQIDELTAKIGTLEAEKASIHAKDAELDRLRQRIDKLTQEKEDLLQRGDAAAKDQIDHLTKEIRELEQLYTKDSEELGRLRGQTVVDTELLAAKEAKLLRIQAELNAQIEALKTGIDTLRNEYASQRDVADEAKKELLRNLAGTTAELAGYKKELEGLKTALGESNAKAARVTTLESQLAEAQRKLTDAEENKKKNDDAHATAIKDLQTQLAAANAEATRLQGELDACTGEKGGLSSQLAAANTRITSLETELDAKKASASEAGDAFNKAKDALTNELEQLKEELAKLTDEKKSVSDDLTKCQASTVEKDDTIRDLEGKLSAAEDKVEGLISAAAAAASEKEKTAKALAKLQNDLGNEKAKVTALDGEKARIAAQLASLTAELEALQNSSSDTCKNKDSQIAEKQKEINRLQKELNDRPTQAILDAKNAELLALQSLTATNKGAIDAQLRKIQSLEDDLNKLQSTLQTYKDDTKGRLQNLLGMLLIDTTLLNDASEFVLSGKQPSDALKNDLCDFFRYFSDMLNLQQQKLYSTRIPLEAKKDIFSIFSKAAPTYDNNVLLREISSVFQEIFLKLNKKETLDNAALIGSYPTLQKILVEIVGKTPLKPQYTTPDVLNEFISFGFLGLYGLEPSVMEGVFTTRKQTSFSTFTTNNTMNYTPLFILGIKLIQLLTEVGRTKYTALAERCGTTIGLETGVDEPVRIPETPVVAPVLTSEPISTVSGVLKKSDYSTRAAYKSTIKTFKTYIQSLEPSDPNYDLKMKSYEDYYMFGLQQNKTAKFAGVWLNDTDAKDMKTLLENKKKEREEYLNQQSEL